MRASDGILDMLPIATFVCDAAGTILQYNQRAVEIWGRAPRPGQTHEDFTAGARFFDIDGKPLARSGFAEVMASGQPVRDVERIVERADGSRVIVSLNIDPLRNAKGEIVGAVNCFLDITERKRMEAALEQFAPGRARAGAAPGGNLRARRHRHFGNRAGRQFPARQRGDLRHHRLQPRAPARRQAVSSHASRRRRA